MPRPAAWTRIGADARARALALHAAGQGTRAIAAELGVAQATAAALLRAAGETPRGAQEHSLQPQQQGLLIARYLKGEGLRRLAAAFDVNDRAVRSLLESHGIAPRPPGRPWASVIDTHTRDVAARSRVGDDSAAPDPAAAITQADQAPETSRAATR